MAQSIPLQNRLLASLSPNTLTALLPKLHQVPLVLRSVLAPAEAVIEHVYFPGTGMISLVATLEDGRQGEVGVIGKEGMYGVSLLAGVDTASTKQMCNWPDLLCA